MTATATAAAAAADDSDSSAADPPDSSVAPLVNNTKCSTEPSPSYQEDASSSSSSSSSVRDDWAELHSPQPDPLPIVVGYAFGPKKMSTMGVVMAEASKAKFPAPLVQPEESSFQPPDASNYDDKMVKPELQTLLSPDALALHTLSHHHRHHNTDASSFSVQTVLRQLRSSCSSVAGSSFSSGTCTASTNTTATTSTPTTLRRPFWSPVRVSFVPLDMDLPLEEQHGGRLDVVLHKLTEDILCLSQIFTTRHAALRDLSQFATFDHVVAAAPTLSPEEIAAVRRVYRLCRFKLDHPNCCLVDNPLLVQTLMSRSEIARQLETCLHGVTTVSGMRVSTPRSVTIQPGGPCLLEQQVQNCGLTFPLIVKPLIAAGTKASHAMAIAFDKQALLSVLRPPCLVQEYFNHDALFFKVYVLGTRVSVHRRRSLPNFRNDTYRGCLQFDSQRPYPRLCDFERAETVLQHEQQGDNDDNVSKPTPDETHGTENSSSKFPPPESTTTKAATATTIVTVEEIQPVVQALRQQFGLELFGFDVLLLTGGMMVVVDVNYFPSYKEVPQFPALLARHLTQHAIHNRRQANHSSSSL